MQNPMTSHPTSRDRAQPSPGPGRRGLQEGLAGNRKIPSSNVSSSVREHPTKTDSQKINQGPRAPTLDASKFGSTLGLEGFSGAPRNSTDAGGLRSKLRSGPTAGGSQVLSIRL
eukprot:5142956-Pyramimonas_sp.AAC.1